jgi:hypothetical protein
MGEDLFLKPVLCYECLMPLTTPYSTDIQTHEDKPKNYVDGH